VRILLAIVLLFNVLGVVRGGAIMITGSLSLKNLLLYASFVVLCMSGLLGKRLRVELPRVQIAFCLLIAYAIVSAISVAASGKYPNYNLMTNLLRIKGDQLDWLLWFTVYSVGVATKTEALQLIKFQLAVFGLANVLTVWNAAGMPQIGADVLNPEIYFGRPRVNGYFGHANETGSTIVTYLPVFIAIASSTRGRERWFWFGCIVALAMVLVGGMSRGALVGAVAGLLWISLSYKKYVSMARFARWAALAFLLALVLVPLFGSAYLDMFIERFTTVSRVSATQMSSGRSELWTMGITAMARSPWSLIGGMGWNTWIISGMLSIPHNHYLWIYFDLGIVGLLGFVFVFVSLAGMARRAVNSAPDAIARRLPLASAYTFFIYCVCMMFTNIGTPWIFIWPLFALLTRYNYFVVLEAGTKTTPKAAAGDAISERSDPYSLPKRKLSTAMKPGAAVIRANPRR
jgi:O-antigen ligase